MLAEVQIVVTKSDIEGWVRMVIPLYDLSTESSVMTFWKKIDLHKNIDKSKLGFANDTKIYVSEILTLYNQCLAWKCRELIRAKKIRKVWSMKGVIKIRQSSNERPYSIYDDDIRYLFPDFIFKESNTPK